MRYKIVAYDLKWSIKKRNPTQDSSISHSLTPILSPGESLSNYKYRRSQIEKVCHSKPLPHRQQYHRLPPEIPWWSRWFMAPGCNGLDSNQLLPGCRWFESSPGDSLFLFPSSSSRQDNHQTPHVCICTNCSSFFLSLLFYISPSFLWFPLIYLVFNQPIN